MQNVKITADERTANRLYSVVKDFFSNKGLNAQASDDDRFVKAVSESKDEFRAIVNVENGMVELFFERFEPCVSDNRLTESINGLNACMYGECIGINPENNKLYLRYSFVFEGSLICDSAFIEALSQFFEKATVLSRNANTFFDDIVETEFGNAVCNRGNGKDVSLTLESFAQCLVQRGWQFGYSKEMVLLSFSVGGYRDEVVCITATADDTENYFVVVGYYGFDVINGAYAANLMNAASPCGCFAYDEGLSKMTFRYSLPVTGCLISQKTCAVVLDAVCSTMFDFYGYLEKNF